MFKTIVNYEYKNPQYEINYMKKLITVNYNYYKKYKKNI